MYMCVYVCMYVCIYVCMYVCIYVCIYVYVCVCVCVYLNSKWKIPFIIICIVIITRGLLCSAFHNIVWILTTVLKRCGTLWLGDGKLFAIINRRNIWYRILKRMQNSLVLFTTESQVILYLLVEDIGGDFCAQFFARVIAPFFLFLYPVYLNFLVTNLSGQQRDLQLYVESKPHRGLKFYHQKYNPLTPWWNERESNPCLSGIERALNPLSHRAAINQRWKSCWL